MADHAGEPKDGRSPLVLERHQPAARPEFPGDKAEVGVEVAHQHQNALRKHDVEGPIRDRREISGVEPGLDRDSEFGS